jgi:amino acid transporter
MADEIEAREAGLKKVLSPVGVFLLTFSALSPVVSFYIGGDAVLHLAGSGAALAFLLGGVASAILSLLYAEIGAAFPRAGGTYPSLAALLGQMTSFPYVVLACAVSFGSLAFTALGLGDYVRVLLPGLPLFPVAAGALLLAAGIAVLNIRFGALVTGVFLAVEITTLVVLIALAALHPARSLGEVLLHPVMLSHGALVPTPFSVLALAGVSGLWATAGANWALYFAEEMHEARSRIGRVIAWTGALAAVSIAAPMVLLVMGADDLQGILAAETPIATFLRRSGGPLLSGAISLGVVAAIFNALIANIMAYGRLFYSTGRDGMWLEPINRFLGGLHPRFNSPVAATVLVVMVAIAAMMLGEKTLLILISGNVADYVLVSLAILVGRRHHSTGRFYKAPLHPIVPLFGLGVTAAAMAADWMDPDAGRPSVILLTGLFLAAMAYFYFRLRETSARWLVADAAPPS